MAQGTGSLFGNGGGASPLLDSGPNVGTTPQDESPDELETQVDAQKPTQSEPSEAEVENQALKAQLREKTAALERAEANRSKDAGRLRQLRAEVKAMQNLQQKSIAVLAKGMESGNAEGMADEVNKLYQSHETGSWGAMVKDKIADLLEVVSPLGLKTLDALRADERFSEALEACIAGDEAHNEPEIDRGIRMAGRIVTLSSAQATNGSKAEPEPKKRSPEPVNMGRGVGGQGGPGSYAQKLKGGGDLPTAEEIDRMTAHYLSGA